MTITIEFDSAQNLLEQVHQLIGGPAEKTETDTQAGRVVKKECAAQDPAETTSVTARTESNGASAEAVNAATAEAELTIEEVRKKATAIAKSGKREEVRKLLLALGSDNLERLDKSKFDTFYNKLDTL